METEFLIYYTYGTNYPCNDGAEQKEELILMSTSNPKHYGMRISLQYLGTWENL
jgi:hypothetical protein